MELPEDLLVLGAATSVVVLVVVLVVVPVVVVPEVLPVVVPEVTEVSELKYEQVLTLERNTSIQ